MKFTYFALAAVSCAAVVACGGNKNAVPETEPAPAPAPVVTPEKTVNLDSAVDRYSYALGMDLGKAIANISVPLKLDVIIEAIKDEVDSSRKVLLADSTAEAALQDLLLLLLHLQEQVLQGGFHCGSCPAGPAPEDAAEEGSRREGCREEGS